MRFLLIVAGRLLREVLSWLNAHPRMPETLPYWVDSASLPAFPKTRTGCRGRCGCGWWRLDRSHDSLPARHRWAIRRSPRARSMRYDRYRPHHRSSDDGHRHAADRAARQFGRDHAQAVWDAGLAAIAQIDSVVREHDIDCALTWVPGYLHAPRGETPTAIEPMHSAKKPPLQASSASMRASLRMCRSRGGQAFVSRIRHNSSRSVSGWSRQSDSRRMAARSSSTAVSMNSQNSHSVSRQTDCFVRCKDIVIATHNPLIGVASTMGAAFFQTKLALYSSYVVAGRAPSGTVPDALFWDTAVAVSLFAHRARTASTTLSSSAERTTRPGRCLARVPAIAHLDRMLAAMVPGFP